MATLRCPRCRQKMAQTEGDQVIIRINGRTWKFKTARIEFYCERCRLATTEEVPIRSLTSLTSLSLDREEAGE